MFGQICALPEHCAIREVAEENHQIWVGFEGISGDLGRARLGGAVESFIEFIAVRIWPEI
jgi:hypothetical protein